MRSCVRTAFMRTMHVYSEVFLVSKQINGEVIFQHGLLHETTPDFGVFSHSTTNKI